MKALFEIFEVSGGVLGSEKDAPLQVSSICSASSQVQPGALFFAIKGTKRDGHDFIGDALKRGALAVVVEDSSRVPAGVPNVCVSDARKAWSRVTSFWFDQPSLAIPVIAVTGTNGKTTTNWLLHHAMNDLFGSSLRSGTLGQQAQQGPRVLFSRDEGLTSPDCYAVQKDLAEAVRIGVKSAVFEVSSHALAQARFDDVAFDVAVFTNLTRDHLDYHGDMESYFATKRELFDLLATRGKGVKTAVVNADDAYGARLLAVTKQLGLRAISFGADARNDVCLGNFSQAFGGSLFSLSWEGQLYSIKTKCIGIHNAQNYAAAFAALVVLGFEATEIIAALEAVPQVPGRLESIQGAPFGVYVDYAHKPQALESVLKSVRPLVPVAGKGQLWVLIGCGGDRDRGKRPQMGHIAAQIADRVIVTSDNPRSEVPEAIIEDILSSGIKPDLVQVDRGLAIDWMINHAQPGDVVVIAGKGHEEYQIVGSNKLPFSDKERALAAIRARYIDDPFLSLNASVKH